MSKEMKNGKDVGNRVGIAVLEVAVAGLGLPDEVGAGIIAIGDPVMDAVESLTEEYTPEQAIKVLDAALVDGMKNVIIKMVTSEAIEMFTNGATEASRHLVQELDDIENELAAMKASAE